MRKKEILYLAALLCIFLIFNFWLLRFSHFLLFDDASHLVTVQKNSFSELFRFLPYQIYNDRPVGLLFIKMLYEIAALNWRVYHFSLVCLHILNCILLYFLLKNIFSDIDKSQEHYSLVPFGTVLLFSIWPTIGLAYWWLAAIFDLLGTTVTLVFCIFFYRTSKKNQVSAGWILITVLTLYIALRTKEIFLTVPFIIAALHFILQKYKKIELTKSYYTLTALSCALSVVYFFILQNSRKAYNLSPPDHPYYLEFTPQTLLQNLYRYALLFTDFKRDVYFFEFDHIDLRILTPLFALVLINIYKKEYKSIFISLCSFLFFIAAISVVLPMKNTQHRLYLYFPSIFLLAGITVLFIHSLPYIKSCLSNKIIALLCFALFCFIAFNKTSGYEIRKQQWVHLGKQDLVSLNSALDLLKDIKEKNIPVISENIGYSVLEYGPGDLIKVFSKDPLLDFILIDHSNDACDNDFEEYLVLKPSYKFLKKSCKDLNVSEINYFSRPLL